jgi:hypothetical protein
VHFSLAAAQAQSGSYRVPANTLLFRGDGLQVATVDGHAHVVLKPVTIGRDYGAEVEITQGLAADDQVILSPPDSIAAGEAVRVSNTPSTQVARS